MSPDALTALLAGLRSCPFSESLPPNVASRAPFGEYFWIRLLWVSETKTFPWVSTLIEYGQLSCPVPLPNPPQELVRLPLGSYA